MFNKINIILKTFNCSYERLLKSFQSHDYKYMFFVLSVRNTSWLVMEGIAKKSKNKAIGRIDDEINKIKDIEIELELGILKKEISRELYNTEMKLIRQREERLLSEREEIIAKVIK